MFCYLCMFPSQWRDLARECLGPWPYFSDVLHLLLMLGSESDYVPKPYGVGGLLLHVTPSCKLVPLMGLFRSYAHRFHRIGGTSYPDGYCYLRWFEQAGVSQSQQTAVATTLGPYPYLFNALMRLRRCLVAADCKFSDFTCSATVAHVTDTEPYLSYPQLLALARMPVSLGLRIGATLSSEVVQCALSLAGIEKEEAFRRYLTDQLKDKNSSETSAFSQAVYESIQDRLRQRKEIVYIRVALSPFDQSTLIELYPELTLNFSKANSRRAHDLAAAMRVCNSALIAVRLGYNDRVYIPRGADVFVKDCGGSLRDSAARKQYNKHSCVPILDVRDSARRSLEIVDVEKFAQIDATLRDILRDPDKRSKFYCNNKSQHCNVRSDYLTFLDSAYDMTNREVADSMDAAGAKLAYITYIFSAEILLEDVASGYIPVGRIRWRKERKPNGKLRIVFNFEDDFSFAYEHDFDTYVQLITSPVFVSSTGKHYVFEIMERRGPYIVGRLVRLLYGFPQGSRLRVAVPIESHLKNKLSVTYYDYTPKYGERDLRNFKRCTVRVYSGLWDKLIGYAMGLTVQKFSYAALFEYARSINQRVIVNGIDVLEKTRMPATDLVMVCQAAYLHAFKIRFNVSTAISLITESIKTNRFNEPGLLKKLCIKLFKTPPVIEKNPTAISEAAGCSLAQRLAAWLAVPELFPIKIDEATHVEDIIVELEKVCMFYVSNPAELTPAIPPPEDEVLSKTAAIATAAVLEKLSPKSPSGISLDEELAHVVSTQCTLREPSSEFSVEPFGDTAGVAQGDAPTSDMESRTDLCLDCQPHSVEVNCNTRLTLERVRGDGNCLFYCLLRAVDVPDVEQLKYELLKSPSLPQVYSPEETKKILRTRDAWGDDEIVYLFCLHYRRSVCLHSDGVCRLFGGGVADLHITHAGNHFDLLVPMIEQSGEVPLTGAGRMEESVAPTAETSMILARRQLLRRDLEGVGLPDFPVDDELLTQSNDFVSYVYNAIYKYRVRARLYSPRDCKFSPGKEFLNNSARKLASLTCLLPGLTRCISQADTVLDLCGAPGGFSQVILEINPAVSLTSVSIADIPYHPSVRSSTAKLIVADIRNELVCDILPVADVIVADGAVEGSYNDDEVVRCEEKIAYERLKEGGLLVLKHSCYYSASANEMVARLTASFAEVYVVKPPHSLISNTEIYFVCFGYKLPTCGVLHDSRHNIFHSLLWCLKNKKIECDYVVPMVRVVVPSHSDSVTAVPNQFSEPVVGLSDIEAEASSPDRSEPRAPEIDVDASDPLDRGSEPGAGRSGTETETPPPDLSEQHASELEADVSELLGCVLREIEERESSVKFTPAPVTHTAGEDRLSGRGPQTLVQLALAVINSCMVDSVEPQRDAVAPEERIIESPSLDVCILESEASQVSVFVDTPIQPVDVESLKESEAPQVSVSVDAPVQPVDVESPELTDGSADGLSCGATRVVSPAKKKKSWIKKILKGSKASRKVSEEKLREKKVDTIEIHRTPVIGLKKVGTAAGVETHVDVSKPRLVRSLAKHLKRALGPSGIKSAAQLDSDEEEVFTRGVYLSHSQEEPPVSEMPVVSVRNEVTERDRMALLSLTSSSAGVMPRMSVAPVWTSTRLILLVDNVILGDGSSVPFDKCYEIAKSRNELSLSCLMTFTNSDVSYVILRVSSLSDMVDKLQKFSAALVGSLHVTMAPVAGVFGEGEFVDALARLPEDHRVSYSVVSTKVEAYTKTRPTVPIDDPVHALWSRTGNRYDTFKPAYTFRGGEGMPVTNAMEEIKEYWRVTTGIVKATYLAFFKENLASPYINKSKIQRACDASPEKFAVFTFCRGADGIVKSIFCAATMSSGVYEVFFDGVNLVTWEQLSHVTEFAKYYVTGKSLVLFQHDRLYRSVASEPTDSFDLSDTTFTFVEGVPGCGKTHRIIENIPTCPTQLADVSVRDGTSLQVDKVLVLTPTRESAQEIRQRLLQRGIVGTLKEASTFVMTIDSYLINKSRRGDRIYELLILEESLMLHAGQIAYAVVSSAARSVLMIGDPQQIPFIVRTPQCDMKYINPLQVFPRIKKLTSSVSFRCTLSVAVTLSGYYSDGMQSVNDILEDSNVHRFKGIAALPSVSDDTVFLTFKQSEKGELMKANLKPVFTVHEFQGKQSPNIVVVRLTEKKEEIYKSKSHALVAFSRHTKSLSYYTPSTDDVLSTLILTSRCVGRSSSRRYLVDKSKVSSAKLPGLFPTHPMSTHRADLVRDIDRNSSMPPGVIKRLDANSIEVLRPGGERVCRGGFVLRDAKLKNFIPTTDKIYSVVKYRETDLPTRSWVREFDVSPFKFKKFSPILVPNYSSDIYALQVFIDQVLPGNSVHDYRFDPFIVDTSDVSLNLEDTRLNPHYKRVGGQKISYDRLHPRLRTSMPVNRPDVQIETLLAMQKRNQAVPELSGVVDVDAMSDLMLNRFLDLMVPEARSLIRVYQEEKILPNTISIKNWLLNQPTEVAEQIEQPDDILVTDHSLYNFKIKPNVKPQLDTSAPYSYQALQTIAYSDKWINANYCPMFKELTDRVISLLRPNIVINIGMSIDELSAVMTAAHISSGGRSPKTLEVDMSKYDKSQGELMLAFERKFLLLFGMDSEFVNAWCVSHTRTSLLDKRNKVVCEVSYQRKSGDASTFIMNTIFLMAVLASLLPLEDSALSCFGGDDSIIFGDARFDVNLSEITAALFNLESKYFRHYNYPYFCSKFLILDSEGVFHVVPDPVKLVTRLGRADLVNFDHAEEYRISLEDLTGAYANAAIYDELSRAVCDRYQCSDGCAYVFHTIYTLCRSPELFRELFSTRPGDNLCMDPTRKKF